jgi:hypothetical protein
MPLTRTAQLSLLSLALLTFFGAPVAAQQQQGDKEFSLGGSLTTMLPDAGDATHSGFVQVGLGYFMSRNLKLSVGTGISVTTAEDGIPSASGTASYGLAYYFGSEGQRTYPYIGAGGTTSFSDMEGAVPSTNASGYVGLQHFFSRNAAFYAQAEYVPLETSAQVLNTFGFRVVF